MSAKLKWKDGKPDDDMCGWCWIANEEGEFAVVEINLDRTYTKPKGFGEVAAWAGPIEEPDESTLP